MKKILVANRGEIALRIMRTCKEMGIQTVAIYSEADRVAPFVLFADEAVCVGESPSNKSYLQIDKIIAIARSLKVEGIHPGYGFLSENSLFAKKVAEAGITFIGPSEDSIKVMGNKLAAKEAVRKYNIPLVPGIDKAIQDQDEVEKIADEIGYPVLIKAAAGGGGKGMRVVRDKGDLLTELKSAISEAESAFGNGAVFIERFVDSPRHIEVQVLADNHGNIVHLFERECSIQRRHQKVIEEAPSSVLTNSLREEMGEKACDVARACNYSGAGTVEFLLDEKMNYYFLEMNTRLQVEHPVTEMITGKDLVREQINVARGEKLSYKQSDLQITGHSIEVRVYAEDPSNGFLPDIGRLVRYRRPQGPGIRIDDGYEENMEIPIYYDSMISKLVVHADDRVTAIEKMIRAIEEYHILGVKTTLSFCKYAINHEVFRKGKFDTNFITKYFSSPQVLQSEDDEEAQVVSIFASYLKQERSNKTSKNHSQQNSNQNWKKSRSSN